MTDSMHQSISLVAGGEKRKKKCGFTNYITAANAETIFHMHFCFLKVSSRWIQNLLVKYKPPSYTHRNVINFFINSSQKEVELHSQHSDYAMSWTEESQFNS